jgi:hypothetical protein
VVWSMLHSKLPTSKLPTIICINKRFHDMLVIFQHIYDRINPQKHHYKALHPPYSQLKSIQGDGNCEIAPFYSLALYLHGDHYRT